MKNPFKSYFCVNLGLIICLLHLSTAIAQTPKDNLKPMTQVITNSDLSPLEEGSNWSFHGQATYVNQWHPAFRAPYTGQNSLEPSSISAQTSDFTLYIGRKLWSGAEFYLNPEIDQGFGFSNTLGLGGFSSGEAYKVGSQDPYFRLPRAFLRQTIDLGGTPVEIEDGPNQIQTRTTENNVVITLGKFSVVDIFDTNRYAHDPRTDFLNWTAVENGAFDYAADAWGFTNGLAVEWNQDWWTSRSGFFLMSTFPNYSNIDLSFKQYQLIQEFEERHEIDGRPGKFKVLGFLSHANMGSYNDAVRLANQNGSSPDTALVRSFTNRMGMAINFEQEITPTLGLFAKASFNDGSKETFDFTDVNQSFVLGLSIKGNYWNRHQDTLGIVQIVNGLTSDARNYFGNGGLGPLIGDGPLGPNQPPGSVMNYGTERISEIFYNMIINKNLALGGGYQYVVNPAFNQDRGPVNIFSFRGRVNF